LAEFTDISKFCFNQNGIYLIKIGRKFSGIVSIYVLLQKKCLSYYIHKPMPKINTIWVYKFTNQKLSSFLINT